MINNNQLKVIVGLGKTGLSCLRFLLAEGYPVLVMDSRREPPGLKELQEQFPQVETCLGQFDEDLLSKANEIIISPGVSLKEPSIAKQLHRNIPVIGDIELFAREISKPVVAITGSNGKSTVTSLVGHLALHCGLKVKVGGNIGIPVLDLLDGTDTDLYVLELSSFQLETTHTLKSLSAVNLNISADHLDRYANLAEYIHAKLHIYEHCQHPIINLDDSRSYEGFDFKTKPMGFTLQEPIGEGFGLRNVSGELYFAQGDKNLLSTQVLSLKGQHQYANVLASIAIGSVIGLPIKDMLDSLPSFEGLPHRCQWLGNYKGVDWYNDSKATNVGSAQAAIMGIGSQIRGKLILLAGGLGKNADFSELHHSVARYVRTLILYGQDKLLIAKALQDSAPTIIVDDLACATRLAAETAKQGDAVILAPACASYDMFQNFEHRGEVFMELVKELCT